MSHDDDDNDVDDPVCVQEQVVYHGQLPARGQGRAPLPAGLGAPLHRGRGGDRGAGPAGQDLQGRRGGEHQVRGVEISAGIPQVAPPRRGQGDKQEGQGRGVFQVRDY